MRRPNCRTGGPNCVHFPTWLDDERAFGSPGRAGLLARQVPHELHALASFSSGAGRRGGCWRRVLSQSAQTSSSMMTRLSETRVSAGPSAARNHVVERSGRDVDLPCSGRNGLIVGSHCLRSVQVVGCTEYGRKILGVKR